MRDKFKKTRFHLSWTNAVTWTALGVSAVATAFVAFKVIYAVFKAAIGVSMD